MKIVLDFDDLTGIVFEDMIRSGLYDRKTQIGEVTWHASDGIGSLKATIDIKEKPQPYEAGDWKDPEVDKIINDRS